MSASPSPSPSPSPSSSSPSLLESTLDNILDEEGEGYIPWALEYIFEQLDKCERIDFVGDESDAPLILDALRDRKKVLDLPPRAYFKFILDYLSLIAEPLFPTESISQVYELVQKNDKDGVCRFANSLPSGNHALADCLLSKLSDLFQRGLLSPVDVPTLATICFRSTNQADDVKANANLMYLTANCAVFFGIERYRSLADIERDYEIVWDPILGKGAYGCVYLVKHKVTGLQFAMKEIARSKLESKREEQRLRTELTILQHIRHPNVASLKAVGDTPDFLYLVMELADQGMLLDDVLKQQAGYPERKAREISLDILRALAYLHERGVVHRDIKPDNILLSGPSKVVKLVDFGLSKLMDPSSLMETLVGSPNYVAPEVITDDQYGPNCDMWSYGCVVYVLLCGLVPFYGANFTEISGYIVRGKYEMPEKLWCKVSAEGRDFVKKLLVVDPDDRLSPEEALAHPWFSLVLPEPK